MEALRAANRGMARAVCQGAKTAKRYAALGAGMEVDAQGYGREPTAMVRGVLSCLFVCLFVPNPNERGLLNEKLFSTVVSDVSEGISIHHFFPSHLLRMINSFDS